MSRIPKKSSLKRLNFNRISTLSKCNQRNSSRWRTRWDLAPSECANITVRWTIMSLTKGCFRNRWSPKSFRKSLSSKTRSSLKQSNSAKWLLIETRGQPGLVKIHGRKLLLFMIFLMKLKDPEEQAREILEKTNLFMSCRLWTRKISMESWSLSSMTLIVLDWIFQSRKVVETTLTF